MYALRDHEPRRCCFVQDRGQPGTAFVFGNVPSALYKAMGGFATNGVNMTKLEDSDQIVPLR